MTDRHAIELLRFATAGSVDDGKSTLIGRLLLDSKNLLVDQIAAVTETSRRRGEPTIDLALITDGLRAEREQGITIDVAYRYFATPRRRFIVADTPGHVQYTRNMVTGTSTADLSLLLVDARAGVLEQTRRHAFISSLLRVPHLAVAVNKMDLVDFDEAVFDAICAEFSDFAAKLEISDVVFVPVCAVDGDNVVEHSARTPWYDGPPLLYHLEHVHTASDRNLIDPRFPVQWVIRPEAGAQSRGYAGQVASGILRPGDDVIVLPSGARTAITEIETFDGSLPEARPPESVTLRLADDVDVSRGDVICRPGNRPAVVRELDAVVCWMSERPLEPPQRYLLKHLTSTIPAQVTQVRHVIDVTSLHRDPEAARLGLNEIGRVAIRTSRPLPIDAYRLNRATGAFILIDETTNDTVAACMALEPGPESGALVEPDQRSANVVWSPSALDREQRTAALGHRGATLWLTGLPASGKSTVAVALEHRLVTSGRVAYRLDGDNLRHGLNGDLGFAPHDRAENVRRTAHVATLLADAGTIVIVSLVSPYASDRALAREAHEALQLPFAEVWINTPLEECERRDPKGLYRRARAGELEGLTGIDDPYEAPDRAELEVRTTEASLEAIVLDVETLLDEILAKPPSPPRAP